MIGRLFTVVILSGVLLTGSGCGSTGSQVAQGTPSANPPSPSPPPASPTVDFTANTRQVCAEVKKVQDDQTIAYITALSKYGQGTSITDPKTKATVVATAKKLMTDWAAALRAIGQKALDPAVKKAIDDNAAALDAAAAATTKLEDLTTPPGVLNSPAMQSAATELTKVCGA